MESTPRSSSPCSLKEQLGWADLDFIKQARIRLEYFRCAFHCSQLYIVALKRNNNVFNSFLFYYMMNYNFRDPINSKYLTLSDSQQGYAVMDIGPSSFHTILYE